MNATLCNMCMIEDKATGRVLVQHRLPKPTNPWCGLTFPGGHVEAGESITTSTVREIRGFPFLGSLLELESQSCER